MSEEARWASIGTVKPIGAPEGLERTCSKGKTKGYKSRDLGEFSRTMLIGVWVK